MKLLRMGLLLSFAAWQAGAQNWDTAGNNLLQGASYFRHVIWAIGDNSGNVGQAISAYGSISFDGNGHYTISNTQVFDSNAGFPQTFSTTGTYSIAASGYGFLSNPLSTGDFIYGLVTHGIFVGSSTDSGFNDLFISAPLASPAPGNSSFQGAYSLVQVDYPTGVPTDSRDSQFVLNADGNGNIAAFQASGYIAGRGTGVINQNFSPIKYFFSNGAANVNFGGNLTNSNLIAGTKYLYFSPDGNFVFGGSPTGWDMMVGVRNRSASPNFGGLYYQAGVNQDESQLASSFADFNTFFGSFNAGGGVLLDHQRTLSVFANNVIDYAFADGYSIKQDGSYDDASNHYIFGAGGGIRIGVGRNPSIGINVAILAPTFSSNDVFINPTGVVNAASSAPFTAGIAPGELISIYGSNLAPKPVFDPTFPTTLSGVQVMVNNRPAPIYAVSDGQISAVVPFGTTESIAQIQVINKGAASNIVTEFVNQTAPGAFTIPPGGIGPAAALHPSFLTVSSLRPAQPGETISLFLTGLGAVDPPVPDGTPGPVSPLSNTTAQFTVYIDGQQATPTFSGLAPQLVGLYQINVQVPSNVHTGNVNLDIAGPDFYSAEAILPVGQNPVAGYAFPDSVRKPGSRIHVPGFSGALPRSTATSPADGQNSTHRRAGRAVPRYPARQRFPDYLR